jgi:hypothetical protein
MPLQKGQEVRIKKFDVHYGTVVELHDLGTEDEVITVQPAKRYYRSHDLEPLEQPQQTKLVPNSNEWNAELTQLFTFLKQWGGQPTDRTLLHRRLWESMERLGFIVSAT